MSDLVLIHEGHPTAQANMDADMRLVDDYQAGVFLRYYRWPAAGITLPDKREHPQWLAGYDVGVRPTGGGLLFHAEGDFLFSLVAPLHDARFPKPLSHKMAVLSDAMRHAFQGIGCTAVPDEGGGIVERQYCHTYPNPYELRYDGDKVCAFALRRFRHCFLIQGLLHLYDNRDAFAPLGEAYMPYFSSGLHLDTAQEEQLVALFLDRCVQLF